MQFIEKHKALLITVLITGSVLLALFSVHLTKQTKFITESYYELEPIKTPEEKILEALALNEKNSQETNKAFNETNDFKEIMKNFKSLNSNDFNKNAQQTKTEAVEEVDEITDVDNSPATSEPSITESELSSYSKINSVIAMRSPEKRKAAASNGNNSSKDTANNSAINRNSSVSYSLKGRKDENLPPPVYLCEESGRIVVNIVVNSFGEVIDTSINGSSNSNNQCLIESALEYAKSARFSSDAQDKQIGSISYYFKGKI